MTRLLLLLATFCLLTSCAQYQEPQANCFTFLAAVAPVEPDALAATDCLFTPIDRAEDDIEV